MLQNKVNEKVKIDRKGKQSCKVIRGTKEEEHRGQGNKCRCDGSEEEEGKGEEKRDREGQERGSFRGEIMMANGNKQREN